MNTAQRIRQAVAEVERLRQEGRQLPALGAAAMALKRLQARRFAGSYADLLAGGPYAAGARFFLEELYNDREYAERDSQFARIAGPVEKLFPRDVAETAGALAELHALTESLDYAMARCVGAGVGAGAGADRQEVLDYVRAWRSVGRRADREAQLTRVVAIGAELARLTRLPGLAAMLKMMRGPAAMAGLSALQRFLEAGFDTFTTLARSRGGVDTFLGTIRQREQALLRLLYEGEPVACETELVRILGQAR